MERLEVESWGHGVSPRVWRGFIAPEGLVWEIRDSYGTTRHSLRPAVSSENGAGWLVTYRHHPGNGYSDDAAYFDWEFISAGDYEALARWLARALKNNAEGALTF